VETQLLNLQKKYRAPIFCSINKRTRSPYIDTFCKKFGIADNQLNLEITPPVPEILLRAPQSAPIVVPNFYSCMFHENKCFQLLEKFGKKFDYVIYYRADVNNTEDLVLKPLQLNTIYAPSYENQSSRILDVDGINNEIAYGNFDSMKIYCSVVFSLEDMYRDYGVMLHPELCFKRFLIDRNKIRVEMFDYKYTLHVGRFEVDPTYDDYE